MDLLQYLKPCNENHSIKEAVITVFLENEIAYPKGFQKLIQSHYKDVFQRFELINEVTIDSSNEHKITKKIEEIGFEFSSYQEGKLKNILRGFNEKDENRYRLSYHTLKYNRWTDFNEEFYTYMKFLPEIQQPLRVKSFGVYYIDDFFWENKKMRIPTETIFNVAHNMIPTYFVESNNAMLSLAKEHFTNIATNPYLERFDIQMSSISLSPDNPSIRITHHVTQDLVDLVDLSTFLEQHEYKKMLQDAHNHNKNVMKGILTQEVLSMIQLI